MKFFITLLIFAGISLSSCSQRNPKMNEPAATLQFFPSLDEAVNKGKTDLVELLRQKVAFQADITPDELEKASQGTPLETYQVDFEALLNADSLSTWAKISGVKEQTVVPLMSGGRMLSTVETAQDDKGWTVIGLHNNDFIRGLKAVQQAIQGGSYSKISMYEVPNIRAKIYVATTPEGDVYFADYPGRYTPNTPLQATELFRVIKEDALTFNKKFGESLKKQELID